MKKIAIIRARSGSKGLKDKNIIDLCGKPLISYTIEAATLSGEFSHVIVSTDSEYYASISRQYGAEVIMRGYELSNDKATTYMVLEDILKNRLTENIDYFVLLQPTSPLRNATHIKEAIKKFEQRFEEFDFLRSEIDPFERKLQAVRDYINSDRGTMGQELAFSQDEYAMDEDWL